MQACVLLGVFLPRSLFETAHARRLIQYVESDILRFSDLRDLIQKFGIGSHFTYDVLSTTSLVNGDDVKDDADLVADIIFLLLRQTAFLRQFLILLLRHGNIIESHEVQAGGHFAKNVR